MKQATLAMIFGMVLLVTMGISSLIPILPDLASAFGIALEDSWRIIAAFALPGLICTPFVGVLADRYGRKRVLIPALLCFTFGGVAGAFADSYMELLVFRMIQGAGSAPLGLLYPTIIADTWTGTERIRAMSYAGMALGIGTAVNPVLGGALGMISWRLPFLLPLLAIPVLLLSLRVPLLRPGKNIAFGQYTRNLLHTVRTRQTIVLLALTLFTFTMLSGPIITCFPMLAGSMFKAGALETGLVIASASLFSGLAAMLLPALYNRFSSRALLLSAFFLYALSFCAIALTERFWLLLFPIALYGLAQGMNIPLVSLLLSSRSGAAERSSLMAINALLLRLGQNLGPAAFGTLAGSLGPAGAIASGATVAAAMAFLVLSTPLPSALENNNEPSIDILPER